MPIQFVDNSTIDKKTRTLIRSHVAKGKNLGRTVHRPSRYPRKRQTTTAVSNIPSSTDPVVIANKEREPGNGAPPESSLSVQRKFQEDLSASLPFAASRTCRRLFHEFLNFADMVCYPPELGTTIIQGVGPRRFLRYAFVDEAFFHCVVAMSVATPASPPITRQGKVESFYHLSRSMRLVNQRLTADGELALSDATLAVIIAMTQHERLLGYDHHALVHFEGLQRIITLRGGISKLVSDCQSVAQKALRADFDFALQFGSRPKFTAECLPGKDTLESLRVKHRGSRTYLPPSSAFLSRVDENLRATFEDVSTIAWLLNEGVHHGITIDDYELHNVLLIVGYRLLNMRPLNAPAAFIEGLESLLHLGLVAVVTMCFLTIGLRSDVVLLNHLIASATLEQHYNGDDQVAQELLLWLLFTGKASVFKDAIEDIWLIPRIAQVAAQLGLCAWDQVERTLRKFPWVRAFTNDAAQALWRQADSFSRSLPV